MGGRIVKAVMRVLSAREAERLTDQIKFTIESIDNGLFKLRNLLEEAQQSNVWQMLGFSSWTAYLASLFEGRPMRLPRDQRQELVGYLSGEGMSTRAIAPIVAADHATVSRDRARVANATPDPGLEEPQAQDEGEVTAPVEETPRAVTADPVTGEVIEEEAEAPRVVVGLDGKNYPAPTAAPRRRSLVDDAFTANTALWRAVETIRSITNDDRYTRNKADILAALQPSADLARQILADLYTSPDKEN